MRTISASARAGASITACLDARTISATRELTHLNGAVVVRARDQGKWPLAPIERAALDLTRRTHDRDVVRAVLAELILRGGLLQPLWNARVVDARTGGFIAVADAWFDEVALAWEIDSYEFHLSPADHEPPAGANGPPARQVRPAAPLAPSPRRRRSLAGR